MRRLGLRARVTAAFAIGALLLSALMALISYELVRRYGVRLEQREVARALEADRTDKPEEDDDGRPAAPPRG